MNIGMLWFDNDPKRTLPEKVSQAADYYRKKYKAVPDVCMVNPKAVIEAMRFAGQIELPGITIQPMRAILPGCLWIGVEEVSGDAAC